VKVEVEATTITEAKRHPVIVTAKCPSGHSIVNRWSIKAFNCRIGMMQTVQRKARLGNVWYLLD
jgi:hypothetical protein